MSAQFPPVSVVIPIKNAEPYLPSLLKRLQEQRDVPLTEILLLDSMSSDRSCEIAKEFQNVRILPISSFSHGGTRNEGIRTASGDWIVLLSQDALPLGSLWMHDLVAPLLKENTAYTFSRQVPYPETNPIECHYLSTSFPEGGAIEYSAPNGVISSPDQVFCSNVSSALKKSVWENIHFDPTLIMGEDQKFSLDVQLQGYRVVYVPDSVVMHSHNYRLVDTFKRFFDSAVASSQIFRHQQMTSDLKSRLFYLLNEASAILRHHPLWMPYYLLQSGARSLAACLGARSHRLPGVVKKRCSMHAGFWQ